MENIEQTSSTVQDSALDLDGKRRLMIILFRREAHPNQYHWSLTTGPADEEQHSPGMLYHATRDLKETMTWSYTSREIPQIRFAKKMAYRLVIGKVKNEQRLREVLADIPVDQSQDDWDCESWVRDAVEVLSMDSQDALVERLSGWPVLRTCMEAFVRMKRAEQPSKEEIQGHRSFFTPTWSLLEGRELRP